MKKAASTIKSENGNGFQESEEEEEEESIKPGDIIQDRFLITEMIGEGSFGQVFKTVDQKNNGQVLAMKVEDEADDQELLDREIKILIELRKKQGFPQIKFYGQQRGYVYCIMNLLGRNLESVFKKCSNKFHITTMLKIAIQILNRIETLHTLKIIHRDIKPENFVLGVGNQLSVVHLIDFGLAKYYINQKGEHMSQVKKSGLIGTARYASVTAHEELEQSRRDDMESIGYILIYLSTGQLPWMNLQIESKELKYAKILSLKKTTKPEVLCQGLPKCFLKYMTDVKSLGFKSQPNYSQLKQYFQEEFDLEMEKLNGQPFTYEWEKLPENQQKKKHQTVHLMQNFEQKQQADIIDLEKTKFEQLLHQKSKQEQQAPQSPKKKKGNHLPMTINVIQLDKQQNKLPELAQYQTPQVISRVAHHKGTYLAPPMRQDIQVFKKEAYPASMKTNYEKSDDVEDEGSGLPQGNQALEQCPSHGIMKPGGGINRNSKKPISQSAKNIAISFFKPFTQILGDDEDVEDTDE